MCSRGCRTVLRVVHLYLKVAIFQPAAFAYYVCTYKLRFLSRKAAADQAGIEPATVRLREQPRNPKTSSQATNSRATRERFDTHGSSGTLQIRTVLQRQRFNHADVRRGSLGHVKKRKKSAVFQHRQCQSPQRVARTDQKSKKVLSILTGHADLRKRSRAHRRNRNKSSFFTSTTPISAEGRTRRSEIAKSPQFFNVDHADLRRGSRAPQKSQKVLFFNVDHADLRRAQIIAQIRHRKKSCFLMSTTLFV